MSARRVVLLRHARTTYNAEGRFQGQLDSPLDDVGLAQAERAADALAAGLAGEAVRIVSSDLTRAARTAQALASRLGGLPIETDQRLREIHGGAWQDRLQTEIRAEWPQQFADWESGDAQARRPGGGESRLDAGTRALTAIDEHTAATDEGTLVCVLHGACAKAAVLLMMLGPPPWPWHSLDGLRNAHWAEVHLAPGGWRLSRWNLGAG